MISQGLALYQLGRVQHITIDSMDHIAGGQCTLSYSKSVLADAEVDGEKPFVVIRGEDLLNFHCSAAATLRAQRFASISWRSCAPFQIFSCRRQAAWTHRP